MKIIQYLVIFLLLSTYLSHAKVYPDIGVNLVDQGAFVNIVNHTNRYINAVSFDNEGWPESDFELVIMDHRPAQEWNNKIDDPEEYRVDYSGRYKSSFRGKADISILWGGGAIENLIYDEQTNISYFDLIIPGHPGKSHAFVYAKFTNTQRSEQAGTNSGITGLKIMRPGYDVNTKKIFTDEYINLCRAANFACYRFYTLQNIWSGEPDYPTKTKWENRKTPNDASQQPMGNTNGKLDAWCWEYIIELANILNKDIWVCLHISCDSNYIRKSAELLKKELNPNINIYVENSNEVWSPTHMKHGPYNQAEADDYGITFNQNYARRTVELSDLFAEVFGSDEINNRIRVILAGQQAYNGRSDQHLDYIDKTYGRPKNFIYATSTALYFGSSNPSGTSEQINNGMIKEINKQISDVTSNLYRKNHIDKANKWELKGGCTSFEGGPHLPAGGGTNNLDNQILAHRTIAMKDILKLNYTDGWFDIGGGLAMFFTLSSSYNRYGCWGLTDDFNKPDRNYKMEAMRELLGQWNSIGDTHIQNNGRINIYPNPFNSIARVEMDLDNQQLITIGLFNQLGERIRVFGTDNYKKGKHSLYINRNGLSNGVYFLKIRTDEEIYVKKIILIR